MQKENRISQAVRSVFPLTIAVTFTTMAMSQLAQAQETTAAVTTEEQRVERVSVVGSKIANERTEAALPVVVFGQDMIDATGVVDGNELVRSMPQMGDITWNESWIPGSSNAARGDMGSINLKNLGASNTLLLINGRRSVIHPTTSTVDNSMSTTTYNTNAIPMFGLDRVEVLLDGAAAIYGSDAIAGVVNIVTQENLEGAGVKLQYGTAPGTNRTDTELSGYFGRDFNEGKGNLSVMYNLSHRTPQYVSDQWYTATADRRSFLAGTDLEGVAALDGRSTSTPWGNFTSTGGQITVGGTPITNSAGVFHVQPASLSGCALSVAGSDHCLATGNIQQDLRYDGSAEEGVILTPEIDRISLFSNLTYEVTDNIDFFGEAGFYQAKSKYNYGSSTTSTNQRVFIPANAYYNPLGAMYLADGTLNPNRIAGLDNVPEEGIAIELRNYRLADGGNRAAKVKNTQFRLLGGLRGYVDSGFEWESAILYSRGKAIDDSQIYSVTKFVDAVSGTTADAYNPFNGGSVSNPNLGDATANSQATIDSFKQWAQRASTSELASWDFKINKPDLFTLPAGDLGFAAGVEVRYESLKDERDPTVDGTTTYTNWYLGTTFNSDMMGTSPTPDSYGSRNVKSAYVEFAVPMIAPEFDIPLLQSLDMQLAGRYESYNDVGDISTPKIALAWGVNDSLLFRASWSEGFKAPNLEVLNADELARFLTYTDYIYCEADVRNAVISGYSGCLKSYSVTWHMAGNPDLKPETSENYSVGMVFSPKFIPEEFGRFNFTVDSWRIQIDDVIGVTPTLDVIMNDLYQRVVHGSSDPRIVRSAPTSVDIAAFAGTGLDAVGEILYVQTDYDNLNSLDAKGIDFNFDWRSASTSFGNFSVNLAASKLLSYKQDLTPQMQEVLAAQQAGLLSSFLSIGTADEVGQNGRKPEWKASGQFIWNYENLTYRLSGQYTGSLNSGRYSSGADFKVPSTLIWNTSFRYTFTESVAEGFSFEVGIRNLFDKEPPLSASGTYLASLYQPFSRYVYASIEKKF